MDWKKIYEEKKCSADEAVKRIKSGDHVVFGHCVSEPPVLVDAMVRNKELYHDVTINHMVSLGKGEYTLPENKEHFRFEGWFVGAGTRKSVAEGHGDFVPVFFHEIPEMIRRGIFKVDVVMVMVSKPDEDGNYSLGVASDYTMQAIESADVVLAEVNDQVPYVYGDTLVNIKDMDAIVETSHPLAESASGKIGPAEEAIGKYCAELIEDGATLQLGIGAIPDAVLAQLKGKKNLGIHSEMIADGVVDLVEAGVINGSEKTLDKGKIMVTFLMGTKKLYDFVNNNPDVILKPVDYVNHPEVVAQCAKMVSINSCMQVDFMGQVVSDSIGIRQFSGVGGQVDFVRGAAMSHDKKGIAIIAMPSVAKKKDGTMISKIVPYIDEGAAVTTSRNDVDYIVTEYGIAPLKGRNLKDRARMLIEIAHPDFREELKAAFEKRFNVAY